MSLPFILGLSGSLKASSTNTRLLRAVGKLLDGKADFRIYEGIGSFPFFNPDNEAGDATIAGFKKQLQLADGVIICTPEYAFAMPGVLKNALEWTVHSGELNSKPVVAISCSPLYDGGNKALASLLLTLGALGTIMTDESSISIGDAYKKINAEGEISDETTRRSVQQLTVHLLRKIETHKPIQ